MLPFTDPQPNIKPVNVRKFTRFSLRFLLIATALSAAYMALTFQKWKKREAAVTFVSELGGIGVVNVDGYAWIRSVIGNETYFHNMKHVVLGPLVADYSPSRPIGDAEIHELIPLLSASSDFQALDLIETSLTDDGVRAIVRLQGLQRLRLSGTQITDASIPLVTQLSDLKELHLDNTQVSANAVADLRRSLPNCMIQSDY